jgi:short-subunit dehydrogenase
MVKDGKKGKICFVGSILSYMSFIGFSNYAPPKQALRGTVLALISGFARIHIHSIPGLADSLRSELMLYGISIHMFFPGSMYTPCWEEENKTKPKITLEIEEGDPGVTADVAAASLYRGSFSETVPSQSLSDTYDGQALWMAHSISLQVSQQIFSGLPPRGPRRIKTWQWTLSIASLHG